MTCKTWYLKHFTALKFWYWTFSRVAVTMSHILISPPSQPLSTRDESVFTHTTGLRWRNLILSQHWPVCRLQTNTHTLTTVCHLHRNSSNVCEYKCYGNWQESGWLVESQHHTFTFDFAVSGSRDQIVSMQVQTGDGAYVSREQLHTFSHLQVPASSKWHVHFSLEEWKYICLHPLLSHHYLAVRKPGRLYNTVKWRLCVV